MVALVQLRSYIDPMAWTCLSMPHDTWQSLLILTTAHSTFRMYTRWDCQYRVTLVGKFLSELLVVSFYLMFYADKQKSNASMKGNRPVNAAWRPRTKDVIWQIPAPQDRGHGGIPSHPKPQESERHHPPYRRWLEMQKEAPLRMPPWLKTYPRTP